MRLLMCKFIPQRSEMEPDTLYVSREFETTIHLCPCCQKEAVCPISNGGWTFDEATISLSPSILNKWCESHYWIKEGKIVW